MANDIEFRGLTLSAYATLKGGVKLSLESMLAELANAGSAAPMTIIHRLADAGRKSGTFAVVFDRDADTIQMLRGNAARKALAAQTERLGRLAGLRKAVARKLKVGATLTREYNGKTVNVTVVEGGFRHKGKTFSSLSTLAGTITGNKINGPAFFGLVGQGAVSAPSKASKADKPSKMADKPARKPDAVAVADYDDFDDDSIE